MTANKVFFFVLANDISKVGEEGESKAILAYKPFFYKKVTVPAEINFNFVMGIRLDITTLESLSIEVETPSGEIIFEGDATSMIKKLIKERQENESKTKIYMNLTASKKSGLQVNEYGVYNIFVYVNDIELYQTELLIRQENRDEEGLIFGDSNE